MVGAQQCFSTISPDLLLMKEVLVQGAAENNREEGGADKMQLNLNDICHQKVHLRVLEMVLDRLWNFGNLGMSLSCAHVLEMIQPLLCKITCLGISVFGLSYLLSEETQSPHQVVVYKRELSPLF